MTPVAINAADAAHLFYYFISHWHLVFVRVLECVLSLYTLSMLLLLLTLTIDIGKQSNAANRAVILFHGWWSTPCPFQVYFFKTKSFFHYFVFRFA